MGNEDKTSSSRQLHNISIGDELISVGIKVHNKSMKWQLPPSKSHAIRSLILASQSDSITTITGIADCGDDVTSMKECLIQLGVLIEHIDSSGQIIEMDVESDNSEFESLRIHGVGKNGFSKPDGLLNVGNSGTTLRLIALLCSRFSFTVTIDGDETLRNRDTEVLWDSIKQSGVDVSFLNLENRLPVKMKGPWFSKIIKQINLDVSKSSQPLSAWMIASSGLERMIEINRIGTSVSNRHWNLSLRMCNQYGSRIILDGSKVKLSPWNVELPKIVEIPKDASMASFAMLACSCLGHEVELIGWPNEEDSIGHEILKNKSKQLGFSWQNKKIKFIGTHSSIEVDITDSNDLITPLSVIMAIGGGGVIKGALHTSFKESNRILSTQSLLKSFGMNCQITNDGISIPGGQKPTAPNEIVDCFGDHRIFMSAYILASKVGANVRGKGLHKVADELFIERFESED